MSKRLSTLDEIRTLTPGSQCEVDDHLETLIENAILVKRMVPGGARYTLQDLAKGEVAEAFRAVEQKYPNYRIVYFDMDHVWYATVSVDKLPQMQFNGQEKAHPW